MPVELTIKGAENLATLGKALRKAGDKVLRRELMKGILRATRPLKDEVKDAWRAELPHKGGLNERVAGSKVTTKTRLSGKSPGVQIVASGVSVSNLRLLESGLVRHPVYGHKDGKWVTTKVESSLFRMTIEKRAPAVRAEIVAAMETTAKQVLDVL